MDKVFTSDELWHRFETDARAALAGSQTLADVRGRIMACEEAGASRCVLIGLDGVSHRQAERLFGDRARVRLAPFLSTVPSTSSTAWTTIMTGSPPSQHGVFGAAQYMPAHGASIFLFDEDLAATGIVGRHDLSPARETLIGDWVERGWQTHCLGFPEQLNGNALVGLWTDGSQCSWLGGNPELRFSNPVELTREVLAHAEALLERPNTFVFAYLNLDWYIHDHGVDDAIDLAVVEGVAWAERMCDRAQAKAFLVSDHGMRPQPPCPHSLLTDELLPGLCYGAAGGGGRIIYIYPQGGQFDAARERVTELVADDGIVMTREEFVAAYHPGRLWEPERIGDLVAVAGDGRFPGAMPDARFEHGGLSRDEMLAFFAEVV